MPDKPNSPLLVAFVASSSGSWRIDRINPVIGEGLPAADRLEMVERPRAQANNEAVWTLRGVTSNVRYTNQNEITALAERQQGLGRPAATRAALIPIRKNEAWWALAQDERRAIFEERSHHIASAWNTCPPSPGDFITAMTSASPLIFLRGLSTRQRTLTLSKGLCAASGKLRSGAMSIAK